MENKMQSIFYEFQPINDGCILNIKDQLLMPVPNKISNIRNEVIDNIKQKHINSMLLKPNNQLEIKMKNTPRLKNKKCPNSADLRYVLKKYNYNKQLQSKLLKPYKKLEESMNTSRELFKKGRPIDSRKKLTDILRISKECGDNGEQQVTLKERQNFWDTMLDIGQWLDIGQDSNTVKEKDYETLLNNIECCEPNDLSSSKSKGFFNNSLQLIGPCKDSAGDRSHVKTIKKVIPDRKCYSYHNFIHINDIIPGISKPKPGVLAAEVDLQACNLAVEELSDRTTSFDVNLFTHFLQDSYKGSKKGAALKIDALGDLLDIKKNLVRTDWEAIKELYIEFKSKGVLEGNKISDRILYIASKCYPKVMAKDWVVASGMSKRLTALKLGAFFLNMFHVCYLISAQEDSGFVKENSRSVILSSKLDEFRKLPSPMLNMYIQGKSQRNPLSMQKKRLVNKALTLKTINKKLAPVPVKVVKPKTTNDKQRVLCEKSTTVKRRNVKKIKRC